MPDFLVLTLVAPMGAFGDLAGHELRGSHGWPGRGAILGLLGAAQGVRRDDAEGQEALRAWRMAVAQLLPGTPLRDFHTAQAVPSARIKRPDSRRHALSRLTHADNPVVTQRDYVTDCAFAVALWGGDLMPARDALLRPRFVLYLGRKSCPLSAPTAPRVVDASDAVAALREAVLPPFAWRSPGPDPMRPILVASDEPLDEGRQETRWDDPTDRARWHFGPRTVHVHAPAAPSDPGA
jgi:CRISPR system Cascade subunit CasD